MKAYRRQAVTFLVVWPCVAFLESVAGGGGWLILGFMSAWIAFPLTLLVAGYLEHQEDTSEAQNHEECPRSGQCLIYETRQHGHAVRAHEASHGDSPHRGRVLVTGGPHRSEHRS
jgi:hypothetical protein